jgi:predicted nucleotidyltransferase
MNLTLDLQPEYLQILRETLQAVVPDCDVWAYGSRVHGHSHDASDLDLVVYQRNKPDEILENLLELQEALIESRLPVLVQVMDWARVPESFKEEIQRGYVVIQDGE